MRSTHLAVLAILLALSTAAAPQQTSHAQHSFGDHKKAVGIANFGEVTPTLYRGGNPTPQGLENLKKMGVSIVIDMRGGSSTTEESTATKLGMRYVSIPWRCPFPTDEPFARFLKIIDDNPGKKIFVHCRLGDDRTGLAIATYRIANEGWSPDEALNEMKEFGFTGVHRVICPGIAPYEKRFPEHLKAAPLSKTCNPAHPHLPNKPRDSSLTALPGLSNTPATVSGHISANSDSSNVRLFATSTFRRIPWKQVPSAV